MLRPFIAALSLSAALVTTQAAHAVSPRDVLVVSTSWLAAHADDPDLVLTRYRMAPVRSDIPQGTLDLLILKVVAPGPLHGYGIAQRLQQLSRDVVQVQQGSLYPALHRLEQRGLLASEWTESDTGRKAKFYRLTRKGRSQLGAEEEGWRRLIEAIGLILAHAEGDVP